MLKTVTERHFCCLYYMKVKIIKRAFFYCVVVILLLTTGLGACQSNKAVDTEHNSRNNVDWQGEYTGVIPAADGPGIDVRITLNSDQTYELRYEYLERTNNVFTGKGRFEWDRAGSVITLDDKTFPPYYLVGENILIQLDTKGKKITGSLANNYILKKL